MTVNLSKVPLVALSTQTKQLISTLLNPPKVIPTEDGIPRDWRGLAHLSDLDGVIMPSLAPHPDPSLHILTIWEQKQNDVTIRDLQEVLEKLDRWDIVDDTASLFDRDAEKYLERLEKSLTSVEAVQNEIDDKVLTVDDLYRFRQGLESQYYDAFLLYADEDIHFATEMINKLENDHKLKLCIKDRDLIGGITFEHEAVMTLISERCNRLIVIVSSNFLKSPANKFFLNYAQALGIDKRQRKVIPCLYEKCQLPPQLSYMFILDYTRVGLYDFWGKLRDSIQIASAVVQPEKSVPDTKQSALIVKKEDSNNVISSMYTEGDSSKGKECREPSNISNVPIVQCAASNAFGVSKVTSEAFNNLETATSINTKPPKNISPSKKQTNLLQWTKKKLNLKTDDVQTEYRQISETLTLPSLPSLNSLDVPETSVDSANKKQKMKFLDKCVKKVQLKKVLLKS